MSRWVLGFGLWLVACRDQAPAIADAGAPEPAPSASVEPRSAEARPEAGALVNPLCEGMSLWLFEPSCEVPDAEWAATPSPERGALVQEATHDPGAGVTFAVVNRSKKPVLVPLRFDDQNGGKSFSVVGERIEGAGIFALAPPRVRDLLPADAGRGHLHSTRIKLLPGGRATAKLAIDFTVTERLDKRGGDGGLEGTLVKVHIGQLFSLAEMGDPAAIVLSKSILKDASAH